MLLLIAMVLTTITPMAMAQPEAAQPIEVQPLSGNQIVWTAHDQIVQVGTQYVDVEFTFDSPGVYATAGAIFWDANYLRLPADRSRSNVFRSVSLFDVGATLLTNLDSPAGPTAGGPLVLTWPNHGVDPLTGPGHLTVRFELIPGTPVGTEIDVEIRSSHIPEANVGPGGLVEFVGDTGVVEIIDLNPAAMVFHANGGSPALQPVVAYVGDTVQFGSMVTTPRVVIPNHPNGYEFLGWSRVADNSPAGIITPTTPWTEAAAAANPTLYAVWGPVLYPPLETRPMTFRGNGARDQDVTVTIRAGMTFSTLDTDPVVATPRHPNNHYFMGWSRTQVAPAPNGGSAVLIAANAPWTDIAWNTAYRTVWAVWCTERTTPPPPHITFAFDSNGGENPSSQAILAELQANNIHYVLTRQPTQPTRENFTFAGWYTARVGGTSLAGAQPFTYDDPFPRVFFARWTPIGEPFGMIFNGNAGDPAIQPVTAQVGPGVQFGNMVTNPIVRIPVHPEGYRFLGWSRVADNDPAGIIAPTTIWNLAAATASPTVFAVWGPGPNGLDPLPMTFIGGGGQPATQAVTAWVHPTDTTFGNMTTIPAVTEPSRSGHIFMGWSDTPSGVPLDSNTPWNLNSPNRVYAQWEIGQNPYPLQITIAFVATPGTPADQIIQANRLSLGPNYMLSRQPTDPTRLHHFFDGWYSDCGVNFEDIDPFTFISPRVFTARWRADTTPVAMAFNANVVGGDPALQSVTAHAGPGVLFSEVLASTDPRVVTPLHPDGLRFLGWSRLSDNNPAGIIAANHVWTVAEATANSTLFAVWSTDPEDGIRVTMTFRGNGGTPDNQQVEVLIQPTTTFGDVHPRALRPEPPSSGFRFAGWSLTQNGPVIPDSTSWRDAPFVATYRTVWAVWEPGQQEYPATISFSFDGNGGAYDGTVVQNILANRVLAGPNYNLRTQPQDPTRLNYIFLGWYTADGVAFSDIAQLTYYNPRPRVFIARWDGDTEPMAMTFVGNGGNPAAQFVVAHVGDGVTFGTLRTDPRVVTPMHTERRDFLGWSLTPDGAVIDPTTVWNNQSPNRVYARWGTGTDPRPEIPMIFRGNTGRAADDQEVVAFILGNTTTFGTLDTNPVVRRPSHPDGLRFLGWSRTQAANSPIIPDNTPWSAAMWDTSYRTVWAQWGPGPEVYPDYIPVGFHGNGGAPAHQTVLADRVLAGPNYTLRSQPEAPTRYGFTFRGWYTAPTGGQRLEAGSTVAYHGVREFYAQWDSNSVAMLFDAHGGTPEHQVVTVMVDTTTTFGQARDSARPHHVVRPQHPERYAFLGWSLTPVTPAITAGVHVIPDSTLMSTLWPNETAQRVVYAVWNGVPGSDLRVRFPMTFVNNNGTGTVQEVVALLDNTSRFGTMDTDPVVVRPTHPDGLRFLGWSLTPTGTPVVLIPNDTVWTQWNANRVYARWDNGPIEPVDYIPLAFFGSGGTPAIQLILADLYDGATFFGSLQTPLQAVTHPDDLDFLGWFTEAGGNGQELLAGRPITYDGPRAFHAHWESFFLEFRFDGDNSNANPRPFDYIRIPVTPGEPVDWSTADGQYVRNIGDVITTGVFNATTDTLVQGHAFWGWFNNITTRADGRDRPLVGATGWDLSTPNLSFTEAQFDTLGDGKVISFTAIFSLWGDADDNDNVDSFDVLLINQWLHDQDLIAWGQPPRFDNPINLRAANVTVPANGIVTSFDTLRINQWLHDQDLIAWGQPPRFFAVLGRP